MAGGGVQGPCCIKDRDLCENSLFVEALNYYCKGHHLRYNRGPRSSSEKCFNNSIYLTRKKFRKETYEKKLIRRALKIITFAFYKFNEYVAVTLTVSNGSTSICCECETLKVLLTSPQIGFGYNEGRCYLLPLQVVKGDCFNGKTLFIRN